MKPEIQAKLDQYLREKEAGSLPSPVMAHGPGGLLSYPVEKHLMGKHNQSTHGGGGLGAIASKLKSSGFKVDSYKGGLFVSLKNRKVGTTEVRSVVGDGPKLTSARNGVMVRE